MPASSKEFLDIQATIECGFTLKCVRDMIKTYSLTVLLKVEVASFMKYLVSPFLEYVVVLLNLVTQTVFSAFDTILLFTSFLGNLTFAQSRF